MPYWLSAGICLLAALVIYVLLWVGCITQSMLALLAPVSLALGLVYIQLAWTLNESNRFTNRLLNNQNKLASMIDERIAEAEEESVAAYTELLAKQETLANNEGMHFTQLLDAIKGKDPDDSQSPLAGERN